MLTDIEEQICVDWILSESWRLRTCRRSSECLIRAGLELIAIREAKGEDAPAWWLTGKLTEEATRRFKGFWLWFVLRILLPIIIRLLLRWCRDRERRNTG